MPLLAHVTCFHEVRGIFSRPEGIGLTICQRAARARSLSAVRQETVLPCLMMCLREGRRGAMGRWSRRSVIRAVRPNPKVTGENSDFLSRIVAQPARKAGHTPGLTAACILNGRNWTQGTFGVLPALSLYRPDRCPLLRSASSTETTWLRRSKLKLSQHPKQPTTRPELTSKRI